MKYTTHALERFAERYPHLNLTEEDGTFKPAPKGVMKKIAKTSPKGYCTPKSNIVKGGGKVYASANGALALVMSEDCAVTFLTNPEEIFI